MGRGKATTLRAIALGTGAAAGIVAVIGGAVAWGRLQPYGAVGSAYLAKQYCSCVFVAGRSEASCHAEFAPDIDRFKVAVDRTGWPARARVTTALAVFRGEAAYARGYGCTVAR